MKMSETFLALRVNKRGSIDELYIEELQIPEPKEGQILV